MDREKQAEDKKAELEQKVRRRVGLEQKAYNIVHHLLDNVVSPQFLVEAGQFLMPSHYQDAVDERSIINHCGFPLCQNTLSYVPKQKYHISLKNKKVFDITERKKFCSNQCFKASEHFMKQISSTPIWGREEEPPVNFTILPLNNGGSAGVEVVGNSIICGDIKEELQIIENIDKKLGKCKISNESKISDHEETNKLPYLKQKTVSKNDNKLNELPCIIIDENESPVGHQELHIDCNSELVSEYSDKIDTPSNSDVLCSNSISKEYTKVGEKSIELNINDGKREREHSCQNIKGKQLDDKTSGESFHVNVKDESCDSAATKFTNVTNDASHDYLLKLLQKKKQKLKNFIQMENVEKDCLDANEQGAQTSQSSEQKENNISEIAYQKDIQIRCELSQKVQPIITPQLCQETSTINQSIVLLICRTIQQWITPDTLKFLNKNPNKQQVTDSFEEKYLALCRKIDSGELNIEDDLEVGNVNECDVATKPLPSYEKLSKETEKFQVKVKHFLEGKEVSRKKGSEESDRDPLLPVIDSHNQLSIRQKIVSDQLDKVLNDVLKPLNLTFQEVNSDFKSLISSFYFSNTNILFKPQEWIVVAIILIVMLARCNHQIERALLNDTARRHFDKIILSLKCSLAELETEIKEMTAIEA